MLSKCCCCIPLRTGSIILAVLGLVGGTGNLALAIYYQLWPNIVGGILYLLSYAPLLYGALKYNKNAVLVSLICSGVLIALGIASCIIAFASIETINPLLADNCVAIRDVLNTLGLTCDQYKSTVLGMLAGTLIVGTLLNIYFWICNYSFYKELKKGDGGQAA